MVRGKFVSRTIIQTSVKLRDTVEQYIFARYGRITFKFTNLKAFFPAGSMDIRLLVFIKT